MRFRSLLIPIAIMFVFVGAALAACGGGDDGGDGATPTPSSGTPGSQTPATAETSTGDGRGAGGGTITVSIADGNATVGQTADVVLTAQGLGAPGLGAYTVDVSFDTNVVSATACVGPEDQGLTFCNADFDPGIVRSVGAIAEGVEGDVSIGTITFTCEAAGTSELTISVDTLADATIGDPTDITHAEENGTITCS